MKTVLFHCSRAAICLANVKFHYYKYTAFHLKSNPLLIQSTIQINLKKNKNSSRSFCINPMEKQQVQYNFHERVVHGNLLYFYLYVNLFTFFGKRLD